MRHHIGAVAAGIPVLHIDFTAMAVIALRSRRIIIGLAIAAIPAIATVGMASAIG